MKKSQLKNIIRESIKGLIKEQTMPVPGSTSPSPNPGNAMQVNWEYCDQTLMNWVAGPNSGTGPLGQFFAGGIPGEGELANDNNTPPSSNGPNDQNMTQCITLGGGNTPSVGDGFKTVEIGQPIVYVLRDARVTSVGACTSVWGGNTVDLPYACGGPATTTTTTIDKNECCEFCDQYGPGGFLAGSPSTPPPDSFDWMCDHPDHCPDSIEDKLPIWKEAEGCDHDHLPEWCAESDMCADHKSCTCVDCGKAIFQRFQKLANIKNV